MPNVVAGLLIAALALQFPLAVYVYVDAKRRDLAHPEMYWLGIVVPTAGFVVILYYFAERDDLPTESDRS